jgi:hypothetical protein
MKPFLLACIATVILLCGTTRQARAQEYETATLLMNLEKLNQFREVLQKMYDGYEVLVNGYNKVKQITSGNFQIHDIFLDALYLVSPEVRKYRRVADIIEYQLRIAKEYKQAYRSFAKSNVYSPEQLEYIMGVYDRLIAGSLQSIDELLLIITARQLRMNDEQRMAAIDRVFDDMQKKYEFLRKFNSQTSAAGIAKLKEQSELQTLKNLHGIE